MGELRLQAALAHDQDAVGDREHLGQLGGDHQHGDAAAARARRGSGGPRPWCATSMPRVGSSTMSTRRLAAQPLGEHDLLLVAAREARSPGCARRLYLTCRRVGPVRREAPLDRAAQQAVPAQPRAATRARRCRRSTSSHHQPLLAAILGHEARRRRSSPRAASGDASGRSPTWHAAGVVADRCRRRPARPRCGRRRRARRARRSRRRATSKLMSSKTPGAGEAVDAQHRRAGGALLVRRAAAMSRPTIARTRSPALSPASGCDSTRRPSRSTVTRWQIANTSSRRCEMKTIAAPSLAQALARRRTGARPRPPRAPRSARPSRRRARRARAPWRSRRSAARRSRGRARRGRDRSGRRGARTARASGAASSGGRSGGQRPQRLAADEDVLGDREVGEQRRLLVDDRDAGGAGVRGAGEHELRGRRPSISAPRVGLMDAAEDLDERRLAGAVLADERVDLAAVQLERHALQRVHGAERLAGVDQAQHRGAPLGAPVARRRLARGSAPLSRCCPSCVPSLRLTPGAAGREPAAGAAMAPRRRPARRARRYAGAGAGRRPLPSVVGGQKLNLPTLALSNTYGGPSRIVWSAPTVNLPSLPATNDWPLALVIAFDASSTAAYPAR